MTIGTIGTLWALCAMVSWGFGDFFIQKVSRKVGIWKTLFFISIAGSVGLLPLVWGNLYQLLTLRGFLFPLAAALITTVASIFALKTLQTGKLAVVEPILSIELPLAAILAVVLWHEKVLLIGWLLIVIIFLGDTLAATEYHTQLHYHKRILEKGVLLAMATAVLNAFVDVTMGASSETVSPLLTVWFVWVFFGLIMAIYLLWKGELKTIMRDLREHPRLIPAMAIFDTFAWVSFCLATSYISIAITTAIGESYIVIAILLGIFANRERLQRHQVLGIVFAVASVICLAIITS
jgi:drug/metabolite transporter (DMT)-like permease